MRRFAVAMSLLAPACSVQHRAGGTAHVDGRVVVVHTVDVQFSVCDEFEADAKFECVSTLLDVLKQLIEKEKEKVNEAIPGI